MPSQAPPQVSPAPAQAERLPCGTPLAAAQVPEGAMSQASHWPEQARSQQTPSTQKPLAQTAFSLHVSRLVKHDPFVQGFPLVH